MIPWFLLRGIRLWVLWKISRIYGGHHPDFRKGWGDFKASESENFQANLFNQTDLCHFRIKSSWYSFKKILVKLTKRIKVFIPLKNIKNTEISWPSSIPHSYEINIGAFFNWKIVTFRCFVWQIHRLWETSGHKEWPNHVRGGRWKWGLCNGYVWV